MSKKQRKSLLEEIKDSAKKPFKAKKKALKKAGKNDKLYYNYLVMYRAKNFFFYLFIFFLYNIYIYIYSSIY